MMDFSETAYGDSWDERTLRLLYLKEILDRIEPPAYEEIPGDGEVTDGGINRWTIPDTRITLARIEEGERAGDFVFSAYSVARLHSFYRRSSHLPYKRGATVGFLEDLHEFQMGEQSLGEGIDARLKPVDATSPREVVEEFLVSVNGAHRLMVEADAALRATPPSMTREQALESEARATAFMDRAMRMLDLTQVPEALRKNAGVETALQLKEILDRAPLPPIGSIPGRRRVNLMRASGDASSPIRWRFPHTELEIVEVTEGQQAGQFVFSAGTVERTSEYYERVQDLRYRGTGDEVPVSDFENIEEYRSPGVSPGIYQHYISTPGYLIAGASRLGALLTDLPPRLTRLYLGQTLWQWIGTAIAVLVALLAFFLVHVIVGRLTRHLESPKGEWLRLLTPLVNAWIAVHAVRFIDQDLNTTGTVVSTTIAVGTVAVFVFVAAAAIRLSVAIGETIVVASPRVAEADFDASLIRVSTRSIGFLVALGIVVVGTQREGANLVPLLAGLGVGGLAVALAVRPTLENMIGGLILYADRPIQIGDYCTFGGQSGTVERIGLRSTRIRALDRTLITVPNSVFADMQLINWARCDKMLITTVIGLRYETTPEQLRHVLANMRQLCFAHPKIETQTLRVRFSGFGTSSLDVTVRVYALTNEWNEFHAIREDLFLRFAEIIEKSGTSVAVPSTTVYMGRDAGLDPDKIEAAEREVAAWRGARELPFPITPEPLAARITDTADYPPKGSPWADERLVDYREEELLAAEGPEAEESKEAADPEPRSGRPLPGPTD